MHIKFLINPIQKNYLCILLLTSFIGYSHGQHDVSLLSSEWTMGQLLFNPGARISDKLLISTGHIDFGIHTDGPTVGDITFLENGKRFLNTQIKDLDRIKDVNRIHINAHIGTLETALSWGSWSIMGGHKFRLFADISYEDDLLYLVTQGNGPYLDQTLSIGPDIDITGFNELYIGGQKRWTDLSVGMRFKLLYGTANHTTELSKLHLTTSSDYYQLMVDTDYLVRASGITRYYALDSITFTNPNLTLDNLFFNNRGIGIDIGLDYRINDKLNMMLSMTDIGHIRWDFSPWKYETKDNSQYTGIDIVDILLDTTAIDYADSLLNIVNVNTSQETYTTLLPTRLHAGFIYHMSNNIELRSLFSVGQVGLNGYSFGCGLMKRWTIFGAGIHYTSTSGSHTNIGFQGSVKTGPVSLWASASNVQSLFDLKNQALIAYRIGIQIKI